MDDMEKDWAELVKLHNRYIEVTGSEFSAKQYMDIVNDFGKAIVEFCIKHDAYHKRDGAVFIIKGCIVRSLNDG